MLSFIIVCYKNMVIHRAVYCCSIEESVFFDHVVVGPALAPSDILNKCPVQKFK